MNGAGCLVTPRAGTEAFLYSAFLLPSIIKQFNLEDAYFLFPPVANDGSKIYSPVILLLNTQLLKLCFSSAVVSLLHCLNFTG